MERFTTRRTQFTVKPEGFDEEDFVWSDLCDIVTQHWQTYHDEILKKPFNVDEWIEDFLELGFSGAVLGGINMVIKKWYKEHEPILIDQILHYETIETVAHAVLEGEVEVYSTLPEDGGGEELTGSDYEVAGVSQDTNQQITNLASRSTRDAKAEDAPGIEGLCAAADSCDIADAWLAKCAYGAKPRPTTRLCGRTHAYPCHRHRP